MHERNIIAPFAKMNIDKYDTNEKKNRVCIMCGFENTVITKNIGHCNMCNTNYKLINEEIVNTNKCCIIS